MGVVKMLIVFGFSFAGTISNNFDFPTLYFYISTAVVFCDSVDKHTKDKTTS